MRYLKRVTAGIDVGPLREEIEANSELWYVDTSRQEKISTQRETFAIALWCHGETAGDDSRLRRAKPLAYRGRPTPLSRHFPRTTGYVEQLAQIMDGTLGRVVLARLKPQGTVYPHADDGLYWLLRDRYHLVIRSAKGSRFKLRDEEALMQEGELWWFDHTVTHEAFNDSDQDRIHVIMDVHSAHSMRTFRKRLVRSPVRGASAFVNAGVRALAFPLRGRDTKTLPDVPAS